MRAFFQSSRWNGLSLDQEIAAAREAGADGFDLFFDGYLPSDLSPAEREAVESWRAEGKPFSFHLPIDSWLRLPPSFPELLAFGRDYRPETVTVHFNRLSEACLLELKASFGETSRVCVENTVPDRNEADGSSFLSWLSAREGPTDITFDMGHAQLSSGDALGTLRSYLDSGARVLTLHAHDNRGDEDSHLSLGRGFIDIDGVLSLLRGRGQDPIVVLEHWTGNVESLAYLRERGI